MINKTMNIEYTAIHPGLWWFGKSFSFDNEVCIKVWSFGYVWKRQQIAQDRTGIIYPDDLSKSYSRIASVSYDLKQLWRTNTEM